MSVTTPPATTADHHEATGRPALLRDGSKPPRVAYIPQRYDRDAVAAGEVAHRRDGERHGRNTDAAGTVDFSDAAG